jgi:hypothetical protein
LSCPGTRVVTLPATNSLKVPLGRRPQSAERCLVSLLEQPARDKRRLVLAVEKIQNDRKKERMPC